MNKYEKLDEMVGTKQKVYYPWEQKFITRVVHEDEKGYFIYYDGEKRGCRVAYDDFGDAIGFEALHFDGR